MTERGEPAQEEREGETVRHGEDSDLGASRGDWFAGRPAGGRQTEWSRVSRMAERHCRVIAAGAARRKGAHAFAAEGGDRSGERQDAEALQDGRRATTAGRLTAASRCAQVLAARQHGETVTYLPRPSPCGSAWFPPLTCPWDLPGEAMRPAAPSERFFFLGGGGVLGRTV